jgi:signal transduction histidine kinase
MEEEEREIVLEVRDNGRGIREEEKTGSPSLGLIGMRERAHLIGGTIEISGAAGKGTVLRLRVPIPERRAG